MIGEGTHKIQQAHTVCGHLHAEHTRLAVRTGGETTYSVEAGRARCRDGTSTQSWGRGMRSTMVMVGLIIRLEPTRYTYLGVMYLISIQSDGTIRRKKDTLTVSADA